MAKFCFHCLRILVILFNLLFVLFGCAILGIAIFLYVDTTFKGIKDNMGDSKLMLEILLISAIGVGGITIIVSTFGCCGAYHESECLLGTYFFCLFIIVAAEIAAGVVGYLKVDEKNIKELVTKSLRTSIDLYMQDDTVTTLPDHLNVLQRRLSCCGAESYKDYMANTVTGSGPSEAKLAKLGAACAPEVKGFSIANFGALSGGCTEKIYNICNENKLWFLIICLSVAAIEILSMIIALSLCCTVRRLESGYIGVST